jgi:hypothetical protein
VVASTARQSSSVTFSAERSRASTAANTTTSIRP